MQKQGFKRHYVVPTAFPASVTFSREEFNLDLVLADQDAYNIFRMNVRNLDGGALQLKKRELGDQPFTAADLATCLASGKELFTGYQHDGPELACGICLRPFQPILIPFEGRDGQKGNGGNFLVLNAAKVADMQKSLLAALGEVEGKRVFGEVSKIAAETTAAIMGDVPIPSRAVVLPVCKNCRETRQKAGFRDFYHACSTVKELLPNVDKKIEIRQTVNAVSAALGGYKRREQHATSSGPAFNRHDRRDEREHKPRVDWHGAQLEANTADALTAAGYLNLTDAITAAENGKLLEQGIAHAGSIGPITFALKRAMESRQVVGNAKSASTLASRTAPGATPVIAKGKSRKTRTVDVPVDRTKRGGAVKLSDLR